MDSPPHRLHSVLISYNRPELTRRALASYLDTVTLPFSFMIVDNGSDDETQSVLRTLEQEAGGAISVLYLGENRYPGFACNRGWEAAPADATLLHRLDNDFVFKPGWCDEVVARFSANPNLGQLGLLTDPEEKFSPINVGGNNIIRRELFDAGLRYDERPWSEFPRGWTEDSFFSPAVAAMGWAWTRVRRPCIEPTAIVHMDDPYYEQTHRVRGIYETMRSTRPGIPGAILRSLRVLAFADELAANPELADEFAASFGAGDDVTLIIQVGNKAELEALQQIPAVVESEADMVAVTESPDVLVDAADVILSRQSRPAPFSRLPRVDIAAELPRLKRADN